MPTDLEFPPTEEAVFQLSDDVVTEHSSDGETMHLDPPMTHSLVSGGKSNAVAFPLAISAYRAEWIPIPSKQDDYRDDLLLPSCCPSNMTWAGDQRNGIQFNIPDAASRTDHVERAMLEPFHLSGPVPLPRELSSALSCLKSTPDVPVLLFRKEQLRRLRQLRADCSPRTA